MALEFPTIESIKASMRTFKGVAAVAGVTLVGVNVAQRWDEGWGSRIGKGVVADPIHDIAWGVEKIGDFLSAAGEWVQDSTDKLSGENKQDAALPQRTPHQVMGRLAIPNVQDREL